MSGRPQRWGVGPAPWGSQAGIDGRGIVLEMFLSSRIILEMDAPLPPMSRKGRGALGNRAGRYEPHTREAVDDGWWRDEELPPLATTVTDEACRSVISRNSSPDVPFDRSINPYRGCEHGCVYCFARPTHAYLGLSPGLDFETKLFAKPDAPRLLAEELRQPGYRPRPIMLGANTDPYQPVERKRQLTRGILEVLAEFRHPVAIATKSALVVRDLDILAAMAERRLVSVGLSITSLDRRLARIMEPRASAPRQAARCGPCAERSRRAGRGDDRAADSLRQRPRAGAHPGGGRRGTALAARTTCCCACRWS